MQQSVRATLEVHFKLFGTDGVSLQSQELSKALRSNGWQVHACASDVPDRTAAPAKAARKARFIVPPEFSCSAPARVREC